MKQTNFRPLLQKPTVRAVLLTVAAGIIAGAVSAFVFRGSVLAFFVALWLFAYVGVPLVILSGILWFILRASKRKVLRRAATIGLFLGVLILSSCVVSTFLGDAVQRYDIRQAKRYCEGLIPHLERYRQENGDYPATLQELSLEKPEPAPYLLRRSDFYESDGDSFSFRFEVDNVLLPDIYVFPSKDGEWRKYT